MPPSIQNQGKIIVEGINDGYLVMFPDGNVEFQPTKKKVETCAHRWFKNHLADNSIGVGEIEWRTHEH